MDAVSNVAIEFECDISTAMTADDFEALAYKYLRKKGPIHDLARQLRDMPVEERPAFGKAINDLKVIVEQRLQAFKDILEEQEAARRFSNEIIDITLPGRRRFLGKKHIITQMLDDVLNILTAMGFTVQYGPDIETDYYNFGALNFAKDHPARDM